jgi:hypothetical protein
MDSEVSGRCLLGFHGATVGGGNPFIPALGFYVSLPVSPWVAPNPQPPSIQVAGRNVVPPAPPAGWSGFHVIVTDGRSPSNPAAIQLNQYFTLPDQPPWLAAAHVDQLYAAIAQAVAEQQLDHPGNLLIVASFGMDVHQPPTGAAYNLFRTAGAGAKLDTWRKQGAAAGDWDDTTLCNYILVGRFGSDPGASSEYFGQGANQQGAHQQGLARASHNTTLAPGPYMPVETDSITTTPQPVPRTPHS